MTSEFKLLLHLVGSAATGNCIDCVPSDIDWDRVESLARSHGVWYLLGYSLKNNLIDSPVDLCTRIYPEVRTAAFSNNIWKSSLFKLLMEMKNAGLSPLLLKGYSIAECYAVPELRFSGDADLYIAKEKEKQACSFLKNQGFEISPRWRNGHHAICNHPSLGCVELHVMLYDDFVEDVWFQKMDGNEYVQEEPVEHTTEDGTYYTLGYTDHMVFLMLHLVKHFILRGMSLQMIMDVALYFSRHIDKINAERFWSIMSKLKYNNLVQNLLWIAKESFSIDTSAIPGVAKERPEQVESILNDLEVGGWLGINDIVVREEGWHEYNRIILMENRSRFQYWIHMLSHSCTIYLRNIFPARKSLEARYSYLKRHPALLPIAWMHRLVCRGPRAVKEGALTPYLVINENKLSSSGKERVAMFRSLDML